uniref:Uncharacterized protein n=1 Tax=Rhizophora mucronata TaxID=61149 RepID=A0A2P2PKY4_RHIMU
MPDNRNGCWRPHKLCCHYSWVRPSWSYKYALSLLKWPH